ncbi:MAG TPA: hypothetical protein VGH66_14855 [Acidimicrobiales bacterium]
MTPVLSALVLTNLLYVVGAVVVASLVSGLYVLRHRKPKSLESGIESFSRELRALAPERRGGVLRGERVPPERRRPDTPAARRGDGATDPAAAPAAEEREDAAQPAPPTSGPGAEGVPGVPVADGSVGRAVADAGPGVPAAERREPDGMAAVPAADGTASVPPRQSPPPGPPMPTGVTVPSADDPSPPPRAPVPPGTDPALTDYGDGRNPGSRSG